ncbi:MAG: M20/M25/M40 family metallo-hydrolase [Bacteroidota bacterium]|nr:M20/M25/M40 family metallo-hydrolase [Bacteroidota bacterium]
MKNLLLIILLLPVFSLAQSKRKKLKMQQRANTEIVANLKQHIQYLADDKLEGRRTGTQGELLAMQYICNQYEAMGIEPRGTNGYVQEFDIDEGKQADANNTFIKVNDKNAALNVDFFPLAFSASKMIKGTPAVALNESGQPWFIDVKEELEENQNNPHFDIFEDIKKHANKIAGKGATALLLYNSSSITDNILFNKNDKSAATKIPVIYITKEGFKKYFSDVSETLNIELGVAFTQKTRKARNVVGFINNNAATTIILGAHYDHLGYGEDKNALDTGHVIHNGADDNASGTAALIELARMLKKSSIKNNNYLLINFSAEELGLFGSKYWLEHPSTNITANYMINMDMVGRYDSTHKLTIGGYGTSPTWGELFSNTTDKNLVIKFDSSGSGPSDHESFYRKEMPVLFFFTGSHSDYHKATDDWDKINYDGEREIVQYVYHLIAASDTKGKLVFTKTREPQAGRSTKFTVSLGVIPDYGYTGTGVRIDGVSGGKLAERIGLQAGDILLQLGEYKFVDVMSYMQALSKFKKGDKTKLVIKRKDEEKEFNIEF